MEGLNYFVIPYGALVLALPFIIWRGSISTRLRPLLLGFWVAMLVGLGGTTPVGHLVLGRAYEVLTMEGGYQLLGDLACLAVCRSGWRLN